MAEWRSEDEGTANLESLFSQRSEEGERNNYKRGTRSSEKKEGACALSLSLFLSRESRLSCRNRDREGNLRYSLCCWTPNTYPRATFPRSTFQRPRNWACRARVCPREKPSGYSAASRVESLEFISTLFSRLTFALNHPTRIPSSARERKRRDIKVAVTTARINFNGVRASAV